MLPRISQFEKASVVIFVVSLAEYDVMCYEVQRYIVDARSS